ncbi:MAG: AsmA-like C-terminal region-containing protein [Acetobacter orientalis]
MAEQNRTEKSEPKKRTRAWLAYGCGGIALLGVAATTVGWFALGHVNLASLASKRATALLGRAVSIQSLTITPGAWVGVQFQNVHVANVAGGSAPDMVQVGYLGVDVKLSSLFSGPMVVRHVRAQGVHVLVERTPAGVPNWRFKTQGMLAVPSAAPTPPAVAGLQSAGHAPPQPSQQPIMPVAKDRAHYPTVLEAELEQSDVTYRTAHGVSYQSVLHAVHMQTQGAQTPISLVVDGAYNTLPVHLEATLQPFAMLRQYQTPYGMAVRITSGDLSVVFTGTATDPLNADGLAGAVQVETPTSAPLAAVVGYKLPQNIPLSMAGQFVHAGDLWQLTKGQGALKGNKLSVALAELYEGTHTQPDHVKADIAFEHLNMNTLLVKAEHAGQSAEADLPLAVSQTPDPLIEAHLTAQSVAYNVYNFQNFSILASVIPGVVGVQEMRVGYLGAALAASGQLQARPQGNAHIQAKALVSGVDIEAYRRALGFQPVPIKGRATLQMTAEATQSTLNAAISHATIAAAVGMTGGTLESAVIRAASADLGLLFHKATGTTPITCLLGVVSAQNGIGQVLPLRLKTEQGTLSANARFNLNNRSFDLIFATQRATTGSFALDIPVRVSGSFAKPRIGLAGLSATGRQMLAQSERLNSLPEGVRQFAQQNACYRAIAP